MVPQPNVPTQEQLPGFWLEFFTNQDEQFCWQLPHPNQLWCWLAHWELTYTNQMMCSRPDTLMTPRPYKGVSPLHWDWHEADLSAWSGPICLKRTYLLEVDLSAWSGPICLKWIYLLEWTYLLEVDLSLEVDFEVGLSTWSGRICLKWIYLHQICYSCVNCQQNYPLCRPSTSRQNCTSYSGVDTSSHGDIVSLSYTPTQVETQTMQEMMSVNTSSHGDIVTLSYTPTQVETQTIKRWCLSTHQAMETLLHFLTHLHMQNHSRDVSPTTISD